MKRKLKSNKAPPNKARRVSIKKNLISSKIVLPIISLLHTLINGSNVISFIIFRRNIIICKDLHLLLSQ